MSAAEAGQMSSAETRQMSAVETGQVSAVEKEQMSPDETGYNVDVSEVAIVAISQCSSLP